MQKFIGVIIVAIIILAVLLAFNLMLNLEKSEEVIGETIDEIAIQSFDCAKHFDYTAELMYGLGDYADDNMRTYEKELKKNSNLYYKNRCMSTVDEWKDRVVYKDEFNSVTEQHWEMQKGVEDEWQSK